MSKTKMAFEYLLSFIKIKLSDTMSFSIVPKIASGDDSNGMMRSESMPSSIVTDLAMFTSTRTVSNAIELRSTNVTLSEQAMQLSINTIHQIGRYNLISQIIV